MNDEHLIALPDIWTTTLINKKITNYLFEINNLFAENNLISELYFIKPIDYY